MRADQTKTVRKLRQRNTFSGSVIVASVCNNGTTGLAAMVCYPTFSRGRCYRLSRMAQLDTSLASMVGRGCPTMVSPTDTVAERLESVDGDNREGRQREGD